MKILELVILAALAGFVLYQLYAVLGRRVGRQPGEEAGTAAGEATAVESQGSDPAFDHRHADPEGIAAIRARDPAFDPELFLVGARSAYEMIVRAYAEGDLAALRDLVAPAALKGFEAGVEQRKAQGRTEAVEFQHQPRADIDKAEMDGDTSRVRVRFLAEFRSRTKGPEGEAVDDRRTAELWTFERDVKSRDPNWMLARVDAAPV